MKKMLSCIVCFVAILCCFAPVVFAADAVMKQDDQKVVAADPKPAVEKAAPVLVSVDLDARIANLNKQREQLAQAGQKNATQRQEIETQFNAVTGALQVCLDMKKEAEGKKNIKS